MEDGVVRCPADEGEKERQDGNDVTTNNIQIHRARRRKKTSKETICLAIDADDAVQASKKVENRKMQNRMSPRLDDAAVAAAAAAGMASSLEEIPE